MPRPARLAIAAAIEAHPEAVVSSLGDAARVFIMGVFIGGGSVFSTFLLIRSVVRDCLYSLIQALMPDGLSCLAGDPNKKKENEKERIMSINRVVISGNLTRDPELRSTAGGLPVLGFGVAVNDRRKNQQTGEWEDYPNFIDCTMFGARGESLSHYLAKGTKVSIEGKLRWSQWEREGQKRSKIEVIVDDLEFMSSRNDSSPYERDADEASPPGAEPVATVVYDDIPF